MKKIILKIFEILSDSVYVIIYCAAALFFVPIHLFLSAISSHKDHIDIKIKK